MKNLSLGECCEIAIERLAASLLALSPEQCYREMLILTTAEDPDFYTGPDQAELASMSLPDFASALRSFAYPYAGDRPLALTHAHERGLIPDIQEQAFLMLEFAA